MNSNLIAVFLLVLIWIINGKDIVYGLKKKVTGEVYHHLGMGLFFTLIVIEKFYRNLGVFIDPNILWLKVIGYILFIPSIIFIFGSLFQLKIKGNAKSLSIQGTNQLVDTGVFNIVRHPMWLGFSLWSLALILCFQSLLSLIIGIVLIILFRLASIKEDAEGIKSFGDHYFKYMKQVPMWNFFKSLSAKILKSS